MNVGHDDERGLILEVWDGIELSTGNESKKILTLSFQRRNSEFFAHASAMEEQKVSTLQLPVDQ